MPSQKWRRITKTQNMKEHKHTINNQKQLNTNTRVQPSLVVFDCLLCLCLMLLLLLLFPVVVCVLSRVVMLDVLSVVFCVFFMFWSFHYLFYVYLLLTGHLRIQPARIEFTCCFELFLFFEVVACLCSFMFLMLFWLFYDFVCVLSFWQVI